MLEASAESPFFVDQTLWPLPEAFGDRREVKPKKIGIP